MARISDPLREWAKEYEPCVSHLGMVRLMRIADSIDAEHESRMEQCRRETMRRCLHRVRSMTNDMERGIKWTRKEQQ